MYVSGKLGLRIFLGMAKLVSQKTDDVKKKILQMIFQKNLS